MNLTNRRLSRKIDGTFLPLFYARDKNDLGIGDIQSLKKAVDLSFLLGQNIIQVLPLTISSSYESPYSVLSSRCLNPLYISVELLSEIIPCPQAVRFLSDHSKEIHMLKSLPKVDYSKVREIKFSLFKIIYSYFDQQGSSLLKEEFFLFKKQNPLLKDHLLFILYQEERKKNDPYGWDFRTWPIEIRTRQAEAIKHLKKKYHAELEYQLFLQWIFIKQWNDLLIYAGSKQVELMGDIPFSVDGADIWIQPEIFGLIRPEFKRSYTQGVPPDYFSSFGQYWQFYSYDWNCPLTQHFIKERIAWHQQFFSILRLDHILGFYRSYLFFEDPQNKATFADLKIWDSLKAIISRGKQYPEEQGNLTWKAYRLFLDTIRKNPGIFPDTGEHFFSKRNKYQLKENNMLLIARKKMTDLSFQYGFKQYVVEKAVFYDQPEWEFLKISRENAFQDHLFLSSYLFLHTEPQETDSLRPCFFRKGAGEDFLKEILKQTKKKNTILIFEALGIVPDFIMNSLKKLKAINYIPMIYGMTPRDPNNPYLITNHVKDAFVTFSLHDFHTLVSWWKEKSLSEKQEILNYLFGPFAEKASDHQKVREKLQRALLKKVYESPSKIAVLLWTDILLADKDGAINQPGQSTGQWVSRMPQTANLDELLKAAKNESANIAAQKAIDLIRFLRKTIRRRRYS
ncbi:MAG: 4-alpha-glucanotransferase [Candidatus Aureabacteria bacterium]|nr:4-alpha-glucanotransferase [Candidatus Auribacterota bacterium]